MVDNTNKRRRRKNGKIMELIYANIKTLSFIFKVSQNKKTSYKLVKQTRTGQNSNLPAQLQ